MEPKNIVEMRGIHKSFGGLHALTDVDLKLRYSEILGLVGDNFPGYPLWVRSIYFRPSRDLRDEWIFWQYADRGRVAGIEGFVDLNVFNGGPEQFRAFLEQAPGHR